MPHFVGHLVDFLTKAAPWELYGVFGFVVMIPLFITSFTKVKKKMNINQWLKLQKYAYLAYALTYIHLVVVAETGHQVIYSVIFIWYSVLKLKNYVLKASVQAQLIFGSLFTSGLVAMYLCLLSPLILFNANELNTGSTGTFKGTATGFKNLTVEVSVEVKNDVITNIIIDDCGCTHSHRGIDFEEVALDLVSEIIDTQSLEVDTVAGATKTSYGVVNAVANALNNN